MKYRFSLLLIGILLLNTFQCAKRATPTGGPRDSLPPIMVNASPKMNTTFFDTGTNNERDEVILRELIECLDRQQYDWMGRRNY